MSIAEYTTFTCDVCSTRTQVRDDDGRRKTPIPVGWSEMMMQSFVVNDGPSMAHMVGRHTHMCPSCTKAFKAYLRLKEPYDALAAVERSRGVRI